MTPALYFTCGVLVGSVLAALGVWGFYVALLAAERRRKARDGEHSTLNIQHPTSNDD